VRRRSAKKFLLPLKKKNTKKNMFSTAKMTLLKLVFLAIFGFASSKFTSFFFFSGCCCSIYYRVVGLVDSSSKIIRSGSGL